MGAYYDMLLTLSFIPLIFCSQIYSFLVFIVITFYCFYLVDFDICALIFHKLYDFIFCVKRLTILWLS